MRADFALMQIRFNLERHTQRAGNDARGLARTHIGTRYHQLGVKQSRNALGGSLRLSVACFRQRQLVRLSCENTLAVAGTLPMTDQDQSAHARCESCKAAISRSQLRTDATFPKRN